jgi:ABC-type polysaccharide/polyol phosphate transport system ATPase subunit
MVCTSSVKFEGVTKLYRLGSRGASLRGAIAGLLKRVLRKSQDRGSSAKFAALDQISFEIQQGESVGLIGPNGSGKTTTLKLISGITRATRGAVLVNGKVSALIELGAGFHPELSGRENIYFNAAILGMSRQEIEQRFDAIVDFSGLERFLDTPVKRYSSGMYCRLGFAVAAHVNPDVLLVDEVLAVGDAAFQAKCLRRMRGLQEEGTTVIFVTHNLGYLQRLCKRAVFLFQGKVVADGEVSEIIQAYRDHAAYSRGSRGEGPEGMDESLPYLAGADSLSPSEHTVARITGVRFSNGRQESVAQVRTGAPLTVHVEYEACSSVEDANCEVWFYGLDGSEYASFATVWDGLGPLYLDGSGELRLEIPSLCLMSGTYFVQVAISDQDGLSKYDLHWDRHKLVVLSGPTSHGLLYQPHHWSVNRDQL